MYKWWLLICVEGNSMYRWHFPFDEVKQALAWARTWKKRWPQDGIHLLAETRNPKLPLVSPKTELAPGAIDQGRVLFVDNFKPKQIGDNWD